MKKTITLFIAVLVAGSVAYAMLPPDAELREPQLRRERMAVDRKYEQTVEKMRAYAIQRHHEVTAGLEYPPWKCQANGAPKPGATLSARPKGMGNRIGHNWMMGLAGLLLIGGLFWVIKQMTREANNR